MMNYKNLTEDNFKARCGSLMLRRVMCVDTIKSYQKEIEDIDKEINGMVEDITKEEDKDGESVQQA